ncbi:hypothetical protein DICPUDRAFT_151611 [Dictyostelium purpureum]|uniref:acetylornithine transaminase n=1 Tax=Dictyostelium purpureum TaxID=5786 RepID=F0ZJA2_DICPU|nr:uncharacterized protein DICPUDRAFT_151611 [Dictyostelium purpureum]EGC36001.1 hypothetical protein DICPUDRAFT_151611 [Dictyostelium purpureum]|eukprot:XP_003287502.1 hypothetical protein DICPUDRAFT_151611 [Dictyostelium purpureum]
MFRKVIPTNIKVNNNLIKSYYSTNNYNEIKKIKLKNNNNPEDWIKVHDNVIMNTYGRVPNIIFKEGKDSWLTDMKNDKYLDFGAGIAVNALGHSNDGWVRSIKKQVGKLTHLSNLYYNEPAIELAKSLIDNSQFFDKVFFANTGTEANEAALKFAKKIGLSKDPNKTEIVAFTNGFSGRSMGSLSVTHKAKYREIYGPLVPGVHFAKYNDIDSIQQIINKNTCAIIIEPVQGEGGLEAATPEFMKHLYKLCKKNDVVMIVDEVQCGIGRTGQLWAHSRFAKHFKPDIMTLAKPLAGGLPIGAVLVNDTIAAAIKPGDHGTTFGGGPLVCAAANYTFNKIAKKKFLEEVREKGKYITDKLEDIKSKYPGVISEIRTVGGLFIGIKLTHPASKLVQFALDRKVLLISAGEDVVRLCPPLTVTYPEIDQLITIIDEYSKLNSKH